MNVRLYPVAAALAVAVISSSARAAFLEFDANAISVQAMAPDGGNVLQPASMTNAAFAGTLIISKNAGSFLNAVLYNSVTHAPITLVNITGNYKIDNGFSDGGSLSLTFQNPDSSFNTYTYNIPVDTVRSSSDVSLNKEIGGVTRYSAGWVTDTSVLANPKVSDMTFPNPLGFGFFTIHDFKPSQVAGTGLGLDNLVNIDIAVDVPTTLPEPTTALLIGLAAPVLLLRRKK